MFRNRIILLVVFALVFGIATASAANTITLDPQSVTVAAGSNSTVTLSIDELPQGLSGYSMNVTLTDPGVAEITSVSYPAWAKLSDSPKVPSDSIMVTGVDIDHQVEPGAKNVVLCSFTVRGDAAGSTGFVLSDLKFDADGGSRITLVPSQGTVVQPATTVASTTTVATQGATGGSSTGGTSGGSSDSSGSPVSGQSPSVSNTTAPNATPVKTNTTAGTDTTGGATPLKVTTTTAAPVQITSSAQPATPTTKAGIPVWGAGCISLIAMGIALLVVMKVKKI